MYNNAYLIAAKTIFGCKLYLWAVKLDIQIDLSYTVCKYQKCNIYTSTYKHTGELDTSFGIIFFLWSRNKSSPEAVLRIRIQHFFSIRLLDPDL